MSDEHKQTPGLSNTRTDYSQHFNTRQTPQSEPIPGTSQVPNSGGGFSWAVDDWKRLDRFLVLGNEGGSYYATERELTRENAQAVLRCIQANGPRVVQTVVNQLTNAERLKRARVHPIALLAALRTYQQGRSERGSNTWTPVNQVVDALDAAFYLAFGNITPTNKRWLLALDVSGSMGWGNIAGIPSLTPRIASAAMAMITAATEPQHTIVGFTAAEGGFGGQWGGGGTSGLTPIAIGPRQRLDDVIKTVSALPMGGTDCALPMLWAAARKVPVDVFVIYTDSETWAGAVHPSQALQQYREKLGIAAKLVVVAMQSNGFTIADPKDAGMLDVVGFDTATPQVMSDFAMES